MSKNAPTIYSVAKLAGVSIATVSRVLNDPQKVNPSTRSRVMQAMDTLGFVPSVEARSRALQNNHRIGVLTPFFTEPAFVQRLRGISKALASFNYELVIYTVDSVRRLTNYLTSLPLTGYLDGLIIISLSIEDPYAQRLREKGLESVLIEYHHEMLCSVEIDDILGGSLVADYFYSEGHRRLAFIGDSFFPDYGVHPISKRLIGFRKHLEQLGVELPEERVLLIPIDVEITRQNMLRLLKSPHPPTAIFAGTDLQAIGVLQAARDLGLRVPDDLAVVGFDDLDISKYFGLTTVCQHLDESGRLAVEILFSRLNDAKRPIQHVQLPLELVKRETA